MDTTEGLTIRPFEAGDRAAVIALWRACGLVVPHNDPETDIDRAAGRANPTSSSASRRTGGWRRA